MLQVLDNSLPDVEQVNVGPKIILHAVPQRSSLLEPQMAEQLVQVLEVEYAVVARGEGAEGLAFCRVAGYVWVVRVHDTGWGGSASPGRKTNTGRRAHSAERGPGG